MSQNPIDMSKAPQVPVAENTVVPSVPEAEQVVEPAVLNPEVTQQTVDQVLVTNPRAVPIPEQTIALPPVAPPVPVAPLELAANNLNPVPTEPTRQDVARVEHYVNAPVKTAADLGDVAVGIFPEDKQ